MDFTSWYDILKNSKNVLFKDLLDIAGKAFGKSRTKGSHHIFKVPWQGTPWVNLQKDGKNAKPYQVKQPLEALKKLEEIENEKK